MQTQAKAAAPTRQRNTLSIAAAPQSKTSEPAAADSELEVVKSDAPATAKQEQQAAPASADAVPATANADQDSAPASMPESASPGASEPLASPAPALPSEWSSQDESAFQRMLARRKAAGYHRRGKDVGAQVIRAGDIAPNPGAIVAAIVALVAEYGSISRSKLLDAMAAATLLHPKAKPEDRSWCQGYVAGAIRDGFLAVASAAPAEESAL